MQMLPPLPHGTRVTFDAVASRGPLQGLATGLAALGADECALAYLTSCDVPLLRPDFVRAVLARLGDADIAVPRDAQHHHPLAAAYRIATVTAEVHALLAADRLRPVFPGD